MMNNTLLDRLKVLVAGVLAVFSLAQCKGSEVLSAEPSAQDLDKQAPTCGGLTAVSVGSGPSIGLTWSEAADGVTSATNVSYLIYMKQSGGDYDLTSPTKIVTGRTTGTISSGVSVGKTYTLFVSCKDEAGNVEPKVPTNERSISVTDATSPSQISDLSAGNATFTSILLTWSPSDDGSSGTTAGAMKYKVYASTSASVNTSTGTPLATLTGSTSYLHSSLNPNERWYYRVVAEDSTGNRSSDSNESTTITVDDTTAPLFSSGTGIAATSPTVSTVPLTWNAASDNVTATSQLIYKIYRCSGSVTCDPFASAAVITTSAGATSYTDTSLTDSMVYVYGVRAQDYRGNLSANTDKVVTSTSYNASGNIYIYPTLTELSIQQGSSIAVANVVGTATGATAYPDLIVGAPLASEANSGYRANGCVYIYAGSATGTFAVAPSRVLCAPSVTADGSGNNFRFGQGLAASDLNSDGVQDLIITYPNLNTMYFYITTSSGGTLTVPSSPNASINQATGATYFGMKVCTGNLDGVGADDILVASSAEGTGANGQINVYLNTSTGGVFSIPSSTPSTTFSPRASIVAGGWTVAAGAGEQVVRSCAVGNFDSANSSNTVIAVGSGAVGSAAGNQTDGVISFYDVTVASTPTITFRNFLSGTTVMGVGSTQWGESLAAVQLQPTTTSSVKTLAVGAPADTTAGTAAGGVYLYSVALSGGVYVMTDLGTSYYGGRDFNSNNVGQALATGAIWGQTNGTTDLAIGAWLDDQSNIAGAAINVGDVYIHRNVNSAISTNISQNGFDPATVNARADQEFGWALCSGDVNNDTIQDVIVGAPRQDYDSSTLTTNTDVGAIYVYHGKSSGEIDFANPSQTIYGPGDQASGLFGTACVVTDYNADGQKDLVVGSAGRTVAGNTRGAVFIYYGASATSLPTSASDTINGPVAQNTAQFGASLAIGDWDNNGYNDLAIGAPGVTNTTPAAAGVGRVYVYWGSATGISSAGSTTLLPPHGGTGTGAVAGQHCGNPNFVTALTRNLAANWNFGSSLASYPTRAKVSGILGKDLVICAQGATLAAGEVAPGSPAVTNEGVCYIYEGSINKRGDGTSAANDISSCATNEIRYEHAVSGFPNIPANFGSGITVGKWGSDTVDDLVICARQGRDIDNSISYAGGCLAFYGLNDGTGNHAGGFSQTSGNNFYQNDRRPPSPSKYRYNQTSQAEVSIFVAGMFSYFGQSVLLLDVNNNTSVDLIVGEPWADSRTGINSTSPPATLGKNSGRVYLLRGGWDQ